jgi:DNA-binding MarR family transcriptional regulator
MKRTAAGEAMTRVLLEIFRVNGALLSAGDQIAGEFGQSSARWQVLGAVDAGARTVPAIAREMGLTRQSVQRTADLLANEGLVEYRDNPAHRRSKLVVMASRGRKIYESITTMQVGWVNALSKEMGTSLRDIDKTLTVLKSLGQALDHERREVT